MEDSVFEAVLKGIKLHLTLKLEYKTAKDSEYQERLFDPYHIICQKGYDEMLAGKGCPADSVFADILGQ